MDIVGGPTPPTFNATFSRQGSTKEDRAAGPNYVECTVTDVEWAESQPANALFDAHRDESEFGDRSFADEARFAGPDVGDRLCGGFAGTRVGGRLSASPSRKTQEARHRVP